MMMMMILMIIGVFKKKGKESLIGQKGFVGFFKMILLDEEVEEEISKLVFKKVKVKIGIVFVK